MPILVPKLILSALLLVVLPCYAIDIDKTYQAECARAFAEANGFPLPVMKNVWQGSDQPGGTLANQAKNVFNNGAAAERIIIVTHQSNQLQEPTAAFLRDTEVLANAPRLVLASEAFPLTKSALEKQASLIRYSAGGKFEAHLNTRNIHLMGGYCELCLQNTVVYAINQVVQKIATGKITLTVHRDYVYYRGTPGEETFVNNVRGLLQRLDWNVPQAELRRYTSEGRQIVEAEIPGPAGQTIYLQFR